jgi:hypothetical protein
VPRRRQDDLQLRLARLGAQARIDELRREEAAIRAAFPDVFAGRPRGRGAAAASEISGGRPGGRRKRRGMSAAARKAVSERMRKYWADRRRKAAKG